MITMVGDLLEVREGIIVHQVNASGKMAAGLAADIRSMYPAVYRDYQRLFRMDQLNLGKVFFTQVTPQLCVASIVGQQFYGKVGVFTDYDALTQGFISIKRYVANRPARVSIPYGIGCGLGGGDWRIVQNIIQTYLPHACILTKSG